MYHIFDIKLYSNCYLLISNILFHNFKNIYPMWLLYKAKSTRAYKLELMGLVDLTVIKLILLHVRLFLTLLDSST